MNTLSESQTDHIIKWVKSHHLTISSLENEFIDHICCDVECLMDEGLTFKKAYESMCNKLGDDILPGLEKQTILQLTFNQRIMKLMTRLTGIIVLLSFFAAIVSNFMGIGYWRTLMAGGMVVLALGFAPLFFLNHYQQQEVKSKKVLHIFGFLAAVLIPLSAFMGLFNSPYAIKLMGVGIVFLLFGFIPLSLLSVSKGSGRIAIIGSIIFLLFFVIISYGFLGVRISKDRVENWIFISHAADQSGLELNNINSACIHDLKKDPELFELAYEIGNKSDKLVQRLSELRNGFILKLSPAYKSGDLYFKGMDNHFAGKKLLIENEDTDQVLKETTEYEKWLISLLSEENELTKQRISKLLSIDIAGEPQDYNSKKEYLFRDFPAIADISVINSLILNVRVAEYQALQFLSGKMMSK